MIHHSDIIFNIKRFNELTLSELYEILRLRAEIFVVEQDCVYQDLDGNDHDAVHIFAKEPADGTECGSERIIAAMRVFVDGDGEVRFGRVVVDAGCRRQGIATRMLRMATDIAAKDFAAKKIVLDSQTYALDVYGGVGFKVDSDEFLEDGIPHRRMILEL